MKVQLDKPQKPYEPTNARRHASPGTHGVKWVVSHDGVGDQSPNQSCYWVLIQTTTDLVLWERGIFEGCCLLVNNTFCKER